MEDEGNAKNFMYNIITFLFIAISLFPIVIVILSYFKFKSRKSREDFLIMRKMIIKLISYLSFLLIFILYVTLEIKNESDFNIIQVSIFSISLLYINFSDLKINYEKYMNYYDPTFSLSDIITKRAKNFFYEFAILVISILITLISYFYLDNKIEKNSVNILYSNVGNKYLISCNFLICPLL